MNYKYIEHSGTHNLRPRKLPNLPRQYGEVHAMMYVQEQCCKVNHTLLSKYGATKGLRLYTDEGDEAVLK